MASLNTLSAILRNQRISYRQLRDGCGEIEVCKAICGPDELKFAKWVCTDECSSRESIHMLIMAYALVDF